MATIGRPKQAVTRNQSLELRLSETEKRIFAEAANVAGIPVSTWVRERLRRVAVRELEEAGIPALLLFRGAGE